MRLPTLCTIVAFACSGACTYGAKDTSVVVTDGGGDPGGEHFTLGAFATVPERLEFPRAYHAMVETDSAVYVIGGMTESALLAEIERASINPDGSLSPFAKVGKLSQPRSYPASVVVGNLLYVFGGTLQTGAVSATIEVASFAPDGTVGPFTVLPATMIHPRVGATIHVIGNSLYLIGGSDDAGALDEVERATIGADGSLGTFSIVSGVKQLRVAHTSHVIGSSLYVLGGLAGSNQTTVDQAAIAGNGFGAFTTLSNVAIVPARANHASVVAGDSVFVLGGFNEAVGTIGAVLQATIDANGALGPFQQLLSTAKRVGHTSLRIGSSVYAIGGIDDATPSVPTGTIVRAPLLNR